MCTESLRIHAKHAHLHHAALDGISLAGVQHQHCIHRQGLNHLPNRLIQSLQNAVELPLTEIL